MGSPVADAQLESLLTAAEAAVAAVLDHGVAPVDTEDAYAVARRVEVLVRRVASAQLAVVGEVQARRLHVGDGHRSARALVGFAARLSSAESGRRSRASAAVADLPAVGAGLAAGRLGVPQVDRIARVHANRRVRGALLAIDGDLAVVAERLPYDEFDRYLTAWERLADEDGAGDRAERNHRRRALAIRPNLDGSWTIDGGCGSLQGTVTSDILAAYAAAELAADWADARARVGEGATVEDLARTDAQRRMDAFERICLDAADARRTDGGHQVTTNVVVDQETFERYVRRAGGDEPGPDRRLETFWADLAAGTTGGRATGGGVRCSTLGGIPLDPAEVVAASLVGHVRRVVLGTDSVTVDVGRQQRMFTGARHLAVLLRSTQCYWPGCQVTVEHCQADHLQPWSEGGSTNPGNGAPCCGRHNRHRNHGFTVERGPDGRLLVRRPDGTAIR